ncbi:hypothetical protein SAMN06265219_11437 [Gracilimonas mengyeensis]|uniref:Uncharacterized protein n=2 Tax=Gracilimonas mengyeensis TaxID=1302730 RepID=A0A521F088_9BACT|nr:hypothetical protein SAMN06265219_11437 [Gracilimonas mengyeensis]
MPRYFSVIVLSVFVILGAGCAQNSDQREFEQEAYGPPQNYTETSFDGEILSTDEDDWRTSPLYQGLVRIQQPPFPNPVNTSTVIRFNIYVTGVQSVNGIEVFTRYNNGEFSSPLYFDYETLSPGETEIQINPMELGRFNNVESARGLHRIFIFTGNQQMISYGDVLVE